MILDLNKINYKRECDYIIVLCAEMGFSVGVLFSAFYTFVLNDISRTVAFPFYGVVVSIIFTLRYVASLIEYENDRRDIKKIVPKESLYKRIARKFKEK